MSHREMPAQLPMDDFQLGEWSVHPQLNRIGRDQEIVQIEPKMMEVLIYLALSPELVRSKREILESVWFDVIVTESVLTRAIAGLRRALGDDTRSPTYIETIARRGYRLVAPVMRAGESRMGRLPAQRVVDENAMAVPYVVGQWVR
ncbi:MAG: transcriptional regulator, partial [bacterium]|nr:transcriptional regulator [bacterium]